MADTAQTASTCSSTPSVEEAIAPATPPKAAVKGPPRPRGPTKFQQLNKLYELPAPLRTFPLPTLVPHNPLSLFHVLYIWLRQTVKPEQSHFDPLYQGWFSPETRSVHVTDVRSIRGLWEQGFYGKGSLSRSEPSWMTREKTRRGTKAKATSEEVTAKRRLERQQVKWERARKEREAIDQKLSEEAEAGSTLDAGEAHDDESSIPKAIEYGSPLPNGPGKNVGENSSNSELLEESSTVVLNGSSKPFLVHRTKYIHSPVGPLELLSLPNSSFDSGIDLASTNEDLIEPHISRSDAVLGFSAQNGLHEAPVGPLELLALPNSIPSSLPSETFELNGHVESPETVTIVDGQLEPATDGSRINGNGAAFKAPPLNGHAIAAKAIISDPETSDEMINGSSHSDETIDASRTPNGHPSTPKIKRQKSVRFSPTVEKNTFIQTEPPSPEHGVVTSVEEEPLVIKNQEHTQLTLEEAFFLVYALGALAILDPATNAPIPTRDLFYLFRRTSIFPPAWNPSLSPDDPFIINYVVYHHFRSLGWVPRSGIKFSCDLMLYNRGPVFDHAEFGVIILPSYSDEYWSSDVFLRNYVKGKEKRTWHWLSCINRVITQVKKTLILCYVDIPRPISGEEEEVLGIHGVLGRYRVKEVVLKRFSANRMRE